MGEVATPLGEVTTAAPDEEITDVLARMSTADPGRALVVSDDLVVGMLSPVDVTRRVELAGLRSGR